MDLLDIKGRIAVALVESVFRRAGYAVGPVPGLGPQPVARMGREDLVPDFAAAGPGDEGGDAPGDAGRRDPRVVEVRYRPLIAQYLAIEAQRAGQSVFALAKRQWPALLFVFVTDHPEPGRSGFQAVDLAPWSLGSPLPAEDLFAHAGLRIYRQNVEEHEALLRRIFALLTGRA